MVMVRLQRAAYQIWGKKEKRKGFGLRKESRRAAFITVSYITLLNESVEKSELSDQ